MLPEVVAEAAHRFAERPAFASADTPGQCLTYRQLHDWSDEVAAGLLRRGLSAGDVVALTMHPCLAYPVAYAAAAKAGAVTAGLNPRFTDAERARLLDLVTPSVVLGDEADVFALRVRGARPDPLPADPHRPVAVVFTSGTTGAPKGAVFGNRQLAAVTRVDSGGRWGDGGRALASTPLSHLGPMTKLPGGLMGGGTTYLQPRWEAGQALELTDRLGLTTIAGIPTQLALMLAHPAFDATDVSSVRLVLVGGGPATPGLVREARARLGVPVCVRYSCTEAAVGTGTAADDPPEDAELTVGRPQPGVEVAIRDGEVVLRSEAVMDRYWNDPEATAEVLTADGFVRTGDLGSVDEQGRLRLVGRAVERYVRGGYNVYPAEAEAALSTHPGVRDVAVIGVPDPVMGEVGVACVVPADPHHPPELADVRAHAGKALASYKLPDRVAILEQLPLTSGDKVDRGALRALAERARSPRGVGGRRAVIMTSTPPHYPAHRWLR